MSPIDAAVIVVGWLSGWLLLWRPATLRGARPAPGAEPVAVVVPARDEVDRLPDLLASLREQTHPVTELVVVDDRSSDATARVARAGGARVVVGSEPPDGWTGKAWACEQGAHATSAPVVVFLDADVTLGPDAVAAAADLHRSVGGLVSVQPRHDVRSPVEALSLVFNVVAVMALGIATPARTHAGWGASGPLLVTSRRDLQAVGGHRAVSGAVAEDLALAARYRAGGRPVTTVLGGPLVRFRMYRDLRGLLVGWHKNMATEARSAPAVLSVGVAVWVTALLVAAAQMTSAPDAPVVAAALDVAIGAQLAVFGRRVGRFGPAAAVWPLLVAVFVTVVSASAVSTFVLRRVRWSGRTVPV